jgi:hypothetical protein
MIDQALCVGVIDCSLRGGLAHEVIIWFGDPACVLWLRDQIDHFYILPIGSEPRGV